MLTLLRHCGRNLLTTGTVQALNKSLYATEMGKRVAVVLAGCGVYDGSEIHEASAVLVHLSRGGASVGLLILCVCVFSLCAEISLTSAACLKEPDWLCVISYVCSKCKLTVFNFPSHVAVLSTCLHSTTL